MDRRQFLQVFSLPSVVPLLVSERPEAELESFDMKTSLFQWARIPLCHGDVLTIENGHTKAKYRYDQPRWNFAGDLTFLGSQSTRQY